MSSDPIPYPWEDLLKKEDWRSGDRERWNDLERWRTSAHRTASELRVVRMHEDFLRAPPCWLCMTPVSMYDISCRTLDGNNIPQAGRCPTCHVRLSYAVLMLRSWVWVRPMDITPEEIITAATRWEETWSLDELPTENS